jgi:hypothetical protein
MRELQTSQIHYTPCLHFMHTALILLNEGMFGENRAEEERSNQK